MLLGARAIRQSWELLAFKLDELERLVPCWFAIESVVDCRLLVAVEHRSILSLIVASNFVNLDLARFSASSS